MGNQKWFWENQGRGNRPENARPGGINDFNPARPDYQNFVQNAGRPAPNFNVANTPAPNTRGPTMPNQMNRNPIGNNQPNRGYGGNTQPNRGYGGSPYGNGHPNVNPLSSQSQNAGNPYANLFGPSGMSSGPQQNPFVNQMNRQQNPNIAGMNSNPYSGRRGPAMPNQLNNNTRRRPMNSNSMFGLQQDAANSASWSPSLYGSLTGGLL